MPARMMVPFGVIVAVAIVFVVIAVLSAAQRANEVAADTERELLVRALLIAAHGRVTSITRPSTRSPGGWG
jgi:hypothetical protein